MADLFDPNLKNPGGPPRPPRSPFWVGNNNSGTSTLYDGQGNPFPPKQNGGPLVGTVRPPGFGPGTQSAPTGVVFNGSPADFLLVAGKPGTQAIFIFATEDGTISGWNPGVNPPTSVTNAILKVDNSDKGSANGAVYKGATSAEINVNKFLYVTNFRSAKFSVCNTNFNLVPFAQEALEAGDFP